MGNQRDPELVLMAKELKLPFRIVYRMGKLEAFRLCIMAPHARATMISMVWRYTKSRRIHAVKNRKKTVADIAA